VIPAGQVSFTFGEERRTMADVAERWRRWERPRQIGRRRYIWLVGVCGWGLSVALLWFCCADRPKLAAHEDLVRDVGPPRAHHIQFPKGWQVTRPNKQFVLSRAEARGAWGASMVVSTRDMRWQYERATTNYPDAWAALEGLTEEAFKRKFERGNHPGRERLGIRELGREQLGKEKAIFVGYMHTIVDTDSSLQCRAYFILRESRWYSVSLFTNHDPPNLHLAEMQQAAATFAFDG
jgi:hypothetical protein